MQIRVLVNCDSRARSAMFRGQVYDLPPEEAETLLLAGQAERVGSKAVEGPPADKSIRTRRTKGRR